MNCKFIPFFVSILIASLGCTNQSKNKSVAYQTLGSIEVLSDQLNEVIDPTAKIEILAKGFNWSEGPVWVPELNSLLFSDVPENKIYSWNETDSIQLFLTPSGYTGIVPNLSKQGSNGLSLDRSGNLLLCQHGDRRVAKLTNLTNPKPSFQTLISHFYDKRFNSPNDLAVASDGSFYFTDPPYGLAAHDQDSLKELTFHGVYHCIDSTRVYLIDSTLTRPNGIALTADEKALIVANSDSELAIWKMYDLNTNPVQSRLLFNATHYVKDRQGLPDGLKINKKGIVFATGPGGVLILTLEGEHLGTILTNKRTANCALSPDEKTLYITADDTLLRVKLL